MEKSSPQTKKRLYGNEYPKANSSKNLNKGNDTLSRSFVKKENKKGGKKSKDKDCGGSNYDRG